MKDPYNSMVREFHEAFGLTVRDTPDVGAPEERVLRVRLMLEEVLEFAKAAAVNVVDSAGRRVRGVEHLAIGASEFQQPDLTAMAHELADVLVTAHGTAVQLGFPALAVVTEIHAAKLRKVGPDGKPIIDASGKLRKPDEWRPADVSAVLKRLNEGEE